MEDFFNYLYRLSEGNARGALNLEIKEDQFEAYHQFSHKGARPDFTPIFYRQTGSQPKDYMTDNLGEKIISERFVNILRDNHITGWDVIPVELHGKDGEIIPGYYRLFVTGRCGPVDDSQSPPVWVDPVPPRKYGYQTRFGYFFDSKTWDGNDIFSPGRTGYIFMTEKVADLLKREKVTNILIRSLPTINRGVV